MLQTNNLSKTTIALHWIVALFIIGMLISGLYMETFKVYALYPWHKSFGVLAILFIAGRILWRIKEKWPISVSQQSKWLNRLSRISHIILITGTLLMPISGMAMSMLQGRGLFVFGFEWLAPNLDGAGERLPINEGLAAAFASVHSLVGYILLATLAIHIAAALKHHFINKDRTLKRMLGLKN